MFKYYIIKCVEQVIKIIEEMIHNFALSHMALRTLRSTSPRFFPLLSSPHEALIEHVIKFLTIGRPSVYC
jgi:hypothetical protein